MPMWAWVLIIVLAAVPLIIGALAMTGVLVVGSRLQARSAPVLTREDF